VAASAKLTGKTLRLTVAPPEPNPVPSSPASVPTPSSTGEARAEAASPLEGSAVVEDSWREPADPGMALARTPPGGFAAVSETPVNPRAGTWGAMGKPDTLRGFPIPKALTGWTRRALRASQQAATTSDQRGQPSSSGPE